MKTEKTLPPRYFSQPWRRRLGWVVAGLLLLWAMAWLAVPPLLKSQLRGVLSEKLGRVVTLGKIDFKPWSLELAIHDVRVARMNGEPASTDAQSQLSIQRVYIDMELQSLLRLAPVVDAVSIESPRLSITHTSTGHYDVDDILAKLAASAVESKTAGASPLRFALYNLVLSDGALEFTDAPLTKVHRLSQLQLSLPFLSNLDSQRDVQVQPKLAFDLNGSKFDSSANTTPFAQSRKTDVQLVLKDLDLAPYLGYLPSAMPVRLASAVLHADVNLAFEQTPQAAVTLSGLVAVSQVKLATAAGADLLSFERLGVELQSVQPLLQRVQLGKVTWSQPHLRLHRNRAGALNVLALGQTDKPIPIALKKGPPYVSDKTVNTQNSAQAAGLVQTSDWHISAQSFDVKGGEILWLDDTLAKPVKLTLSELDWQSQSLAWPFVQPVPFEGSTRVASAMLKVKGTATDQAAQMAISLADFPLNAAAPYVAAFIGPRLDGMLSSDLAVQWSAARVGQVPQTQVALKNLRLDQLSLTGDKKAALASIRQLSLDDVVLDLDHQSATFGRVQLKQPKVGLTRALDGRWMFQDWLKTQTQTLTDPSIRSAKATLPAEQKPWSVVIHDLQLADGALSLADHAAPQPVVLEVAGLEVQVKNLSTHSQKPFTVNLTTRLRHGHTEPGKLVWRGSSSLNPLAIRGDVNAEHLPLHALAPYASEFLNVAIKRADTSFKGRIQVSEQAMGMAVQVSGDTRLDDLQVFTLGQTEPFRTTEELLNWKSLSLTGLDVVMHPGLATQVTLQGAALSDFYARLVLSEAGRLNLQDAVKSSTPAAPPESSAVAIAASGPLTVAPVGAPDTGRAPVIRIGPISLVGGHVNFTDRFIKPNYSANLTELVGKLSAVSTRASSGEIQLADLELRGRAEGSATLEVLGKINPLVQPLALDIKGKVRDLELAPLSTYSARYAGYGIERGKLSVDVAYKVQPDGMLTANNNVVLNQLKFGEQVPGASNSLPVKLAVALLADRNGVIDIDLPISGSLNDPQFRLMPIVFKIIGNLIVKAITAPFSLLASAFGGASGDDLSVVSFEPGTANLSDAAKARLDKVAKALQDRPALKMTVVGTASLDVEREAFKRNQLQAMVLADKRRTSSAAGVKEAELPTNVTAQEYPELLKVVYKRGDFPKPRNLIGLTKDIPTTDMEALLLAHLNASEPAMQALAVKRGVVVRDYLASLRLPAERLFLGAAKAVAPDAKWQPRAELTLATE